MRFLLSTFVCLLPGLFLAERVHAIHVLAGEITARGDSLVGNQNSLRYIFTFTMYRDDCDNCIGAKPMAVGWYKPAFILVNSLYILSDYAKN